jgi:NMD protein affecting ribosome stability and mRNA decay
MRKCVRCGRRLMKSEKLEMCESCRKETLKKFLASVLPDVESSLYKRKMRKST